MAEAVFQHKVREAGLADRLEADSAGTGHWHVGSPPHEGTRTLLAAKKIAHQHRARLLTPEDLDRFDYVITMDDANLRAVQALGRGRARVAPLMHFASDADVGEVPDPYYTGGFEGVYALVDTATTGLLETIRREHGL